MFPISELAPRICTCAPPPGAPLFMLMFAPTTLPCSAFSIDTAGARVSSSALTEDTDVAAFFFSIVVAVPVTVTPSSWRTSLSSAKSAVPELAGTTAPPRLKPIALTSSVTSACGTRMRYSPRSLVRTPAGWPTTPTVASASGVFVPACTTLPVISRVAWARTIPGAKSAATRGTTDKTLRTCPPSCGLTSWVLLVDEFSQLGPGFSRAVNVKSR